MDLVVRTLESQPGRDIVEVVERKGRGHPDTLCDAIAEGVCGRLCRYYLDRFGRILHHNVDKVLLCGGSSRCSFGGGEILQPMEIYLAGRATMEHRGEAVPVHELAVDACRQVLGQRLPELDRDRDVRIVSRIRPGSSDLTHLFGRGERMPLANDTSAAAGFAPLTDLERVVLGVERSLTSAQTRRQHPYVGSDVKVMGVRREGRIVLTIGCAFIARHVANIDEYVLYKEAVQTLALDAARNGTRLPVEAVVNAADDIDASNVFLSVVGTSADSGDDGEVGRGNRANGLITPFRPMTMEAAAGKNPVSHIGKIFSVVADRIATRLVVDLPGVRDAACVLVGRIGHPVDDPELADIRIAGIEQVQSKSVQERVDAIVRGQLQRIPDLPRELLEGELSVY